MTEHEKKFLKWKEDTRRTALENEVERLKEENQKKSESFKKLKISFITAGILIIASYAIIFFFLGNKEMEGKQTSPASEARQTKNTTVSRKEKTSSPQTSTGQIKIIAPVRDTILLKIPSDGILFSVQIGAYLGKDLNEFNKNMLSLHQHSSSGINQFTLGIFPEYEQAKRFRKEVLTLGLKDAYIIAIKNGKRLNVEEALNQKQ
ncbi:hypothetical protein [Marinilabilia rubra]|uniref:SPOR domain-containing protein n=1 Tax=Marinilabilia rubra TaxID=2162893 RepID=A0A2U2BDL7_9BACT|nr:hypothetical protein [Marinilabilia rubra]PWE01159.1 hypothetical protein DDZ16_01345 [Marinilabilia rubra]